VPSTVRDGFVIITVHLSLSLASPIRPW